MPTTYTYSTATDFTSLVGALDTSQLQYLLNTNYPTNVNYISQVGTNVYITFTTALTGPQQTTLTSTVNAYNNIYINNVVSATTLQDQTGQTVDLEDFKNSSGTTMASVSSTGIGNFNGLVMPASSTITNGTAVLSLPSTTDTLVGRATTDTMTNKTLTGTTNTIDANTLRNGSTWAVAMSGSTPATNSRLTYNGSNAIWLGGDIQLYIALAPSTYTTGTVSQSTTTVTGSGTTFTTAMVGGLIIYSTGAYAFITAFGSTTSLTVDTSQTVTAGTSYTIYYGGLQSDNAGNTSLNNVYNAKLFDTSNAFVSAADVTKQLKLALSSATTSTSTTLTASQTANRVLTLPDATDTLVGRATTDTMTNKTMTGATNTLTASLLKSATTEVSVSAATAPTSGQVLTATSGTTATWQAPGTGGFSDAVFAVNDATDATKQFKVDAAGTTSTSTTLLTSQTTNRVLTLPDATDTLVARNTTDTMTNKTLSAPIFGNNLSAAAWGLAGIQSKYTANTYTDTSSTGTVSTITAVNSFRQPTLAASSATTYTDSATVYIDNAPAAGTNATLTNKWAAYVGNGNTALDGDLWIRNKAGVTTTRNLIFELFGGSATSFFLGTDTGDHLWQGGRGYSLQMGAYYGIQILGSRRTSPAPSYRTGTSDNFNMQIANTTDTVCLQTLPLASGTADQIQIMNSSSVVQSVFNYAGYLGIGITAPSAKFEIGGAASAAAWGNAGIQSQLNAATYTDTSSTGTVATNMVNSIGQPTLAASSATTYTNSATLYIDNAPAAGTNVTLTNKYGMYVNSGKSYFGDSIDLHTSGTTGNTTFATSQTANRTLTLPDITGTLMTNHYAIVADTRSAGTNGGNTTSGSFQTRTLQTINTNMGGTVTLASNQFTITTAGTFLLHGWSTFFGSVGSIQTRIQNITGSSTAIVGQSGNQTSLTTVTTTNHIGGTITTNGSTVFELQYRVSNNVTNGLGNAVGFATSEIYAVLTIQQIA